MVDLCKIRYIVKIAESIGWLHMKKEWKSKRYALYFGVGGICVSVVVVWSYLTQINYQGMRIQDMAGMVGGICFVILCITIIWFIAAQRIRRENRYLDIRLHAQYQYYEELELLQEDVRDFQANVNGYLQTIQSLIQDNCLQQAQQFTEDILGQSESVRMPFFSEHDILNVLLYSKYKQCRQEGIQLQVQIEPSAIAVLSEVDMVSLFSNLLDNAIEACARLQQEEKQCVIKAIEKDKQYWYLCRNSKDPGETPLQNHLSTLKRDVKNHGIGTRVIKSLVKKYQGTIQMQDEGNMFEVVCMLPMQRGMGT